MWAAALGPEFLIWHARLRTSLVWTAHSCSAPTHSLQQPPPPPPSIVVPPGNVWPIAEPPWFFADNLAIWAKNAAFADEPRFMRAYQRGMQSGHHMVRPKGSDTDIHLEWRTHVMLW